MSVQRSLTISFMISACSFALVMFSTLNNDETLIPIGILGAKAGMASGFSLLYFSSINFFENKYLGF